MQLHTKVHTSECWRKTGKAPIKVRRIDINKGDAKDPNYRSRSVAKEIDTCKKNELFAATPPLEHLKDTVGQCKADWGPFLHSAIQHEHSPGGVFTH